MANPSSPAPSTERSLRFLSRASEILNASLDYHATTQAVLELVVPELADNGALYLLDEAGVPRRVAYADPGWPDEAPDPAEGHFRLDVGFGVPWVLRTGQPSFIREIDEETHRAMAATEVGYRWLKSLKLRQSIVVPLAARGRVIGVLNISSRRRDFEESDVALALELASRAAMAIDNARLYRDAQRALERKQEEIRNSALLQRVGALLASELDPDRLARLVTEESLPLIGAQRGVFVPRGTAAGEAPAGGSRLVVPLRSRAGEVLGELVFDHAEPHAFGQRHVALVTALAAQAGIALENARLLRQAREAEARSRASEERMSLVLEAGRMGYFDVDLRTGRVFTSPRAAEMLELDPEDDDGGVGTVYAHIHPEDRSRVEEAMQRLVRENGSRVILEYRVPLRDGSVRWIEVSSRLARNDEGVPIRRIGVLRDVTAARREEAQARQLASEQAARAEAEAARERIADLLEAIGEPIFAVDPDERLRFVNGAAERLLGRERGLLVDRPIREAIPFEELAATLARCARVSLEGARAEQEARLPGGEYVEVRAGPFGEGACVSLRDVTAQRRAREAQDRRAHLEALRADVGSALATPATLREMLTLCAAALTRHLGLAVATIWRFEPKERAMEVVARSGGRGRIQRLGADHAVAARIVRERRPWIIDDLRAAPDFFSQQNLLSRGLNSFLGYPLLIGEQIVGMLTLFAPAPVPEDARPTLAAIADILAQGLERKRTEEALAARASELARSNADLEHFAYVASHDLQAPLRTVASYAQLLSRRYQGKLDADAEDFIRFMVEGVTRMKRLIEGLLEFSRVGSQGQPLAPVRAGEVLGLALGNLEIAIGDSGAEVMVDPMPEVLGDEVQLEQLFQNLVANAIKFRRDDEPPRVHISAARHEDGWLFSVKDNGIGISPENLPRLFGLFQRLNEPGRYPGTGIGLAMCKRIVERHGGRVWVESTPGQGATFFFTLKAVPAEPPPEEPS